MTKNCKWYFCGRCCFKLSWVCSGFISFILLLVCVAFGFLVIPINDVCKVMDKTLQNESYFDTNIAPKLDADVKNNLRRCFWNNDGDLAA